MGKNDKNAKWTVMVYPVRKPCRLGRDNMKRTFVSYQGHVFRGQRSCRTCAFFQMPEQLNGC